MAEKKILIHFDLDDTVTIEAQNFSGKGCKTATKPYEDDLLGGDAVMTKKDEFVRPEVKTQSKVGR